MKISNFILPLLMLCAFNVSLSALNSSDEQYIPTCKLKHGWNRDPFPGEESKAIAYLEECRLLRPAILYTKIHCNTRIFPACQGVTDRWCCN